MFQLCFQHRLIVVDFNSSFALRNKGFVGFWCFIEVAELLCLFKFQMVRITLLNYYYGRQDSYWNPFELVSAQAITDVVYKFSIRYSKNYF